ncbi:MAG TPA: protein phosphatase 2C domain-containing protein [Acidobacteriaceae bacterium]|jgi:protein phosphatase
MDKDGSQPMTLGCAVTSEREEGRPFLDGPKAAETHKEMVIEVAAMSDVGCKRPNNEDSFGYDLQSRIFVVCDGMGGMAAGEVASATAVEQLLRFYEGLRSTPMEIEHRLNQAIAGVNLAVWTAGQENEELHRMGTTLVTACVDGDRVVIGNVGDSRAYFLRDGVCVQITEDHSCAAERVPPELRPDTDGGLGFLGQFVTRAVGVEAIVKPDFFTGQVRPGDMVLLATDGLTRYAESEAIAQQVDVGQDLAESCRILVETAKAQGGVDNITCLLLRFQ